MLLLFYGIISFEGHRLGISTSWFANRIDNILEHFHGWVKNYYITGIKLKHIKGNILVNSIRDRMATNYLAIFVAHRALGKTVCSPC